MGSYLILATVNLVLGGLAFLLGMLILRENPWQRLNRVTALMLFFGGFGSLLAALGFFGTSTAPAGQTVNPIQSLAYLWEFFFPSLFLFASLFPSERRFARALGARGRPRFMPPFEVLVYLPHIVHFIVLLGIALWSPSIGSNGGVLGVFGTLARVIGLFAELFLAVHQAMFSLVNLGFGIGAVLLLGESYRRARVPRVRQQVGAIGAGLTLCLVLYTLSTLLPTLFGMRVASTLRSSLVAAALAVGTASIAYSMVRYKFLDARLLARRGILYALASALMIGIYLLLVEQVNRLVTSITRIDTRVVEPVFLIVALVLFQPILSRLEVALDRIFLRDPGDYRNVLRQLGRDLLGTLELDALLTRSTHTIAEAMLLRSARIVAISRDRVLLHSSSGEGASAPECEHLRDLLMRMPEGGTLRLSDAFEGIGDFDRELLVNRFDTALLLPLRSGGEAVGGLLLGPRVTGTEFTSEDVNLLESLAAQMSVSLQNALLIRDREQAARLEEELRLAQQIQRSFLMSEFPPLPQFDVHAVAKPSKEVGGDFYDLVPTGDGGFVVAIADVAGKGVPAALLSSMLQASLRTQAASIPSVAEILRNINALVYRGTQIHQFATFFLARVNHSGLELTFSNAGHNFPVVLRADGSQRTLERGGTVLGILESIQLEEDRVVLAAGDRLVLYTDGLTEAEAPDGSLFGEERLYKLLAGLPSHFTAREMADHILEEQRRFTGGGEARDDTTIMVLRVLEPDPVPRTGDGAGQFAEATVV